MTFSRSDLSLHPQHPVRPGPHHFPPSRALKASQGKQLCGGAKIWPATISHCTNTGLGWLLSDWPSPRPCDSGLAGCSPATDTVDGLLGWRLSLVQNGVSLRLTPWSLDANVQMRRLPLRLFSTGEIIARLCGTARRCR